MNRIAQIVPAQRTAPECPGWCASHNDDYDRLAPPEQRHTRAHLGPEHTMQYALPGATHLTVTVTVRLERFDVGTTPGSVGVAVFGTEDAHADDPEFASIGINDCTPMDVDDAARFAHLVSTVAGGAR